MVAERLVASLRCLHGWKHWAAEWLGWITETWSNDRALLVEVTDVADVQVLKPRHPGRQCLFVLETIRTGAMRVIHIPVKTEETQRLRLSYLCTQLENRTS